MPDSIKDVAAQWGKEWTVSPDSVINTSNISEKYKVMIFERILRQLPEDAAVLEIGCGNGAWLRLLRERHPKLKAFGLDVSSEAVAISTGHGIQPTLGDARNMPYPDDTFDLVFSFGTIEYFPETERAVWEHIRVMKPGGFVWIEIPNRWSLQGLEAAISNARHHRDPYERMVEQGKWYCCRELKRMAKYYPVKKHIRIQGGGPVVPYFRYFWFLDPIFPGFIRRFFGGSTGIIVQKETK